MLVELLEDRVLLSSAAYSLSDVSGSGLASIGTGPAINDNGYIAFSATNDSSEQNVYAVSSGGKPLALENSALTLGDSGTAPSQTFDPNVQINNQNRVLAQRILYANVQVGFPFGPVESGVFSYLESWDATQVALPTQVAMGDGGSAAAASLLTFINPVTGGVYPSKYDSGYGLAGIYENSFGFNNNGQAAYAAIAEQGDGQVLAVGPDANGQLDSQIGASQVVAPKLADDGSVVINYDGSLLVLPYSLEGQDTIASAATGFDNIGNPDISESGKFIGFYADLTSAGATAYNATITDDNKGINSKTPTGPYSALTPGPGIFVAQQTSTGQWVIQQAASVGGISRLSGFVTSDPVSVASVSADQVIVAYAATDAQAGGAQGIFTTTLVAANAGNPAAAADPQLVGEVGQTVAGLGKITAVNLNQAVNDRGTVAFWAASGSTQAVIQALPQTTVAVTTRYTSLTNPKVPLELVVTASGSNDTIIVSQSGSTLTITANETTFTESAPAGQLFIYTRGGEDSVAVDASVTTPTTVETIDAAPTEIQASNPNLQAWIDSTDIFVGNAVVHKVATYNGGTSKAVGVSLPNPSDSHPATALNLSLFGPGPVPGDVNQGHIGDCAFLASLAGLANQDPQVLESSAVDMGDGTFTVQFQRNGSPVFVRVNNTDLTCASPGTDKAIWAMVMEKALADFETGANTYLSIYGISDQSAFEALGITTSSLLPGSKSDSALYTLLYNELYNRKAVTLDTKQELPANTLVPAHAYTIVRVFQSSTGVNEYQVRNPWGNGTRGFLDSTGTATLTYSQIVSYFDLVTYQQ